MTETSFSLSIFSFSRYSQFSQIFNQIILHVRYLAIMVRWPKTSRQRPTFNMVELAIHRLGRFSAFNLPEMTFWHEAQPITSAYVANVINICCLDSARWKIQMSSPWLSRRGVCLELLSQLLKAPAPSFFTATCGTSRNDATIFRHSSLFLFLFSLDELDLSNFFTTRNKDWDGYCLMKREKKTQSTR